MKSKTLFNRSGRTYPHNAIYEILTYRNPEGAWKEPKKYDRRTLNEFTKMMSAAPTTVKAAYEIVFSNENTLTEAGKLLKVSPTTVRKYLNDIFFIRDEHGYLIANLEKMVRGSYKNVSTTDGMNVWEHIEWYLKYHCKNKHHCSTETIDSILEMGYENADAEEIAKFHHISVSTVKKVLADYDTFKKGEI